VGHVRLSVIDHSWARFVPLVVPKLEKAGYHRYWVTEHHGYRGQCSSPTLLAAIAASCSEAIRVGTAGVLLNYHSPAKVAEDFTLLESFFPGRVDLGVARGKVGIPQLSKDLLDGRSTPDPSLYQSRIDSVLRYLADFQRDNQEGFLTYASFLTPRTTPPLWLCGTSLDSAHLAGRVGASYSFGHHHLLQQDQSSIKHLGVTIVDGYRESCERAGSTRSPHFNVVAYGLCAESESDASSLWRACMAAHSSAEMNWAVPSFLGSPLQCREQLLEIQAHYGCDEIVIQSLAIRLEDRLRSYALLSDIMGLAAPGVIVG
jgi:luciferase family oxidoreductase group 1